MVKECKVVSYNPYSRTLVFDYDGKNIQKTCFLKGGQKVVYVNKVDNKYVIVDASRCRAAKTAKTKKAAEKAGSN